MQHEKVHICTRMCKDPSNVNMHHPANKRQVGANIPSIIFIYAVVSLYCSKNKLCCTQTRITALYSRTCLN